MSEAKDKLTDKGLKSFLDALDYGPGLREILIVFVCFPSLEGFKQRIRMDRKGLILYMDLFLDYELMANSPDDVRNDHVARKVYEEVPPIVRKYKLKEFDTERFIHDLQSFIEESGLLMSSTK